MLQILSPGYSLGALPSQSLQLNQAVPVQGHQDPLRRQGGGDWEIDSRTESLDRPKQGEKHSNPVHKGWFPDCLRVENTERIFPALEEMNLQFSRRIVDVRDLVGAQCSCKQPASFRVQNLLQGQPADALDDPPFGLTQVDVGGQAGSQIMDYSDSIDLVGAPQTIQRDFAYCRSVGMVGKRFSLSCCLVKWMPGVA